MVKFISAGNQHINLNYVRVIKCTGKNEYAAIMDNGEIIDGIRNFETMPMEEVPAQEGWECLGPGGEKGEYQAYPVVSWSITPNGVRVPVLSEQADVQEIFPDYVVRRIGDDAVHHSFYGTFKNVFEWLDTFRDTEKLKAV